MAPGRFAWSSRPVIHFVLNRVFQLALGLCAAVGVLAQPASAFERLGVPSCDAVLARYDTCLKSVTAARCAAIAKQRHMSSTYQQPGPAGAARGPRTFSTPAEACMAEMADLRAEMDLNIKLMKTMRAEAQCAGVARIAVNNTRSLCDR